MAQTKALVDKLLTNVSQGYVPAGYISNIALPELKVKEATGLIGKYTNQHLKRQDTKMGGRGLAKRVESVKYDVTDGYVVGNHGLEDVVTKDDLRNVSDPFSVESDKVMGLTQLMKIDMEYDFASIVTNSSVITNGTTLSGTAQWSAYSTSTPINDVATARETVKLACGFFPNRAIISARLAEVLSYHPEILKNLGFKYEKAGALTFDDIKKFFKVDMLHVGDVQYDTSVEGIAESMVEMWAGDVVFYYAPTAPTKFQKSLGYMLTIEGETNFEVYKAPLNNPPGSTSIIVTNDYGFKVANSSCGYLIKSAI